MEFVPNRTTAAHEAAHAVVGQLLGLRVELVSIVPDDQDGGRLGHVRWANDDGLAPIARSLARITATLAGTLGEEFDGLPRGYLRDDSGWHDRAQAIDDALKLAVLRDGGESSSDEILDRAAWEAAQLVEENRETIIRVTDALMARGVLNRDELLRAIAGVPSGFLGTAAEWEAFNSGKAGKGTQGKRAKHTVLARSPYPREHLYRGVPSTRLRIVPAPAQRGEREAGDSNVLTGHFAVFNVWSEIDSAFEGHFLESIAPGAFTATIKRDLIRCIFQHGHDPYIGLKPLGPFDELREDETGVLYAVPLLDTEYNNDHLAPGIREGLYGASFRFSVMREEFTEDPGVSAHNPKGLPERVLKEVRAFEGGPVTWGAYPEATAGMRSLTDEFRALADQASNRPEAA